MNTAVAHTDTAIAVPDSALRKVRVIKAANHLVDVDTGKFSDQIYSSVFDMGLEVAINARMTKITKANIPDDEARHKAAIDIAKENAAMLVAGELTKRARKAESVAKANREEVTEAMRIARLMVKDEIKRQGGKLSHYSAAEITRNAKIILEANPAVMDEARKNLAVAKCGTAGVKIEAHVDPKRVKAAEEKAKAKKTDPLSAKQSGIVAKHKPPVTVQHVH